MNINNGDYHVSENEPDYMSNDRSSGVSTLQNGHEFETVLEVKTKWIPMIFAISMHFVCSSMYTTHLSAMWLYLMNLDKSIQFVSLALCSVAPMIGSSITLPIYGYWNQRRNSIKVPAITGFIIAMIGQLMYFFVYLSPSIATWSMVTSRFIVGVGIGNIAVFRSYAVSASVPKDRIKVIAVCTAAIVLGLSLGIGFTFKCITLPLDFEYKYFRLDKFNVSSLVFAIICLISALLTCFAFTETYSGLVAAHKKKDQIVLNPINKIAAVVTAYWYVMAPTLAISIQSMTIPLTDVLYDWTVETANYVQLAGCAVVSICSVLIAFTPIGRMDRRILIAIGLFFLISSQIAMFPWDFYSEPLSNETRKLQSDLNAQLVIDQYAMKSQGLSLTKTTGCLSANYNWCSTTSRTPSPIFLIYAAVFFGFSVAFIQNGSITMLSEILGPRKQGFAHGIAMGLGRMGTVFSIVVTTFLFLTIGYGSVIIFQAIVTIIGIILLVAFYRQAVPMQIVIVEEDKPKVDEKKEILVYKIGEESAGNEQTIIQ